MSREIKFRAWDKELGKYLEEIRQSHDETLEQMFQRPYWVFEQFTGLHDKAKREIWEGNIVRVHMPDCCDKPPDPDHYIYQVVYRNGRWELWHDEGRGFGGGLSAATNLTLQVTPTFSTGHGNQSEVIGNIHENRELLP